jgi:hypothetical protein
MADRVVPEDWKDNFRMTKSNFLKLCDELRPFIEATNVQRSVCSQVPVEKQVAVTLYYLVTKEG